GAGLGNILASEALFRARLHPVRPAGRLSGEEIARLRRAIRAAARESLRRQRGAEIPYPQGRGERNPFLVYGRAGKPCPRCGAAIWRIVQSGRSTYYCSTCQPRRHRSKVRGRGVS
ncbi:MAG: zinc finger domain-containing protein, partial [Acidobacteriota bacterium]